MTAKQPKKDQPEEISDDQASPDDSVQNPTQDNEQDGAQDDNTQDDEVSLDIGDHEINFDEVLLDPMSAFEAEKNVLKDQVMRALAEAENTKRRAERELEQARKYGLSGFARDLLNGIENLIRAVDALPDDRDTLEDAVKNLVSGVEMVSKEMITVLEKHGITRISPEGEKFDHTRHQAMYEIETDEAEAGVVVQVAQAGWMLHDRLLTPAMVGVAKPTAAAKKQ